MARSNKYTSINFNDIFEKKSNSNKSTSSSTSTSSSSSSPSLRNSSRSHGGMLVLTRPSPKPLPQIFPSQTPKPHQETDSIPQPRSEPNTPSDPISLRPLGRTGSSTLTPSSPSPTLIPSDKDRESLVSLKPEPFVPPHLRPGFVGKEERLVQNGQKNQGGGLRSREIGGVGGVVQIQSRSPSGGYDVNGRPKSGGGYDVNGRPKSGGGYERMRRGGESDLGNMNMNMNMNRPNSSGNRPGSGGWYGSSSRSTPHF